MHNNNNKERAAAHRAHNTILKSVRRYKKKDIQINRTYMKHKQIKMHNRHKKTELAKRITKDKKNRNK